LTFPVSAIMFICTYTVREIGRRRSRWGHDVESTEDDPRLRRGGAPGGARERGDGALGVGSALGAGFDSKTITVQGIGPVASGFGDADVVAVARIKRANDTNELKGIKVKYAGFADDKADVATATSEARRLIEQKARVRNRARLLCD
jgi:hypothetical protein